MPSRGEESRLRQGAKGTAFVVALGLTVCALGLLLAAALTWVLT